LARLLLSQGRIEEMVELLQPLDDWFEEGRDLPQLVEMRTLLIRPVSRDIRKA